MPDYSQGIIINAPAQHVFGFVSDANNLPKYLPTVRRSIQQGGERVRLQGSVQGHDYDSDGPFHVNREEQKLEWGSDGERDYRGRLEVTEHGDTSEVRVSLHFGDTQQFGPDPDHAINNGIREALELIRQHMEGASRT